MNKQKRQTHSVFSKISNAERGMFGDKKL